MNSYSSLKSKSRDRLGYWVESAKQDFMISIHNSMIKEEITKSALAEKVGCSPAYISKILKGDVNFTIETMVKISRALNTKLCIHLSDPHDSVQWRGVVSRREAPLSEKPSASWAQRPEKVLYLKAM